MEKLSVKRKEIAVEVKIKEIAVEAKGKEIAVEFANAVLKKDIKLIEQLLSDKGGFNIEKKKWVTLDVNKEQFIKWFEQKLRRTRITKVDFDQCLYCMIGNTVVLFNEGQFPIKNKYSFERPKTGLMLDIKDDKIVELRFCYTFLKTENYCKFERDKEY